VVVAVSVVSSEVGVDVQEKHSSKPDIAKSKLFVKVFNFKEPTSVIYQPDLVKDGVNFFRVTLAGLSATRAALNTCPESLFLLYRLAASHSGRLISQKWRRLQLPRAVFSSAASILLK
jgi:hypothetical protein